MFFQFSQRGLLSIAIAAAVGLLYFVRTTSVSAANFTYVGPNNGLWHTATNWSPFIPPGSVPPPLFGDFATINTNADVVLNNNVLGLIGLDLSNQGDLLTSGYLLAVYNGDGDAVTTVEGTGTTGGNTQLFVQPNTSGGFAYSLLTDVLNLESGGEMDLVNNAEVRIRRRLDVDALSIITGRGTILFDDIHGVTGRRLNLRGTLRPDSNGTITLIAESGTIDLDGSVHNDNLVDLTNSGSRLNVDGPLTDSFTGSIHMGSNATLDMTDAWVFGPEPGNHPGPALIQIDAGAGTATIRGGEITIGGAGDSDANVNVLSGTGRISADAVIQSNADINVFDGGVLDFDGRVTYTGAASITGLGEFDPGNFNVVLDDVTIATDIINFDGITGGDSSADEADWDIRAHLTLDADTIDDNGSNVYGGFVPAGDPTIEITTTVVGGFLIEDGRLTVNLPGTDRWTLADNATMNINGPTTGRRTHLAGSELVVEGDINVDGHSRFEAAIDVDASGVIQFANAAASLELISDSLMSGGTITGGGTLMSNAADVRGYGQIVADVDFSGTSEIWADNGTLRIAGNLDDLGAVIGTADDDGTLLIEDSNWRTDIVGEVRLNGGGWIDGAASSFVQNTEGGQIRGHGAINVQSINNYSTIAAEGGVLTIVGLVDWDGSDTGTLGNEGDGILAARQGDLLISHTMHQGPSFVGTIQTGRGHSFIYDTGATDDEILFDDVSGNGDEGSDFGRLSMTGGSLVTDVVTHRGRFTIEDFPSTIVADEILFDDLGHTTINSQLRLDTSAGVASFIEPAATFDGTGSLANTDGSVLIVQDQAEMGVELINAGQLFVGAGLFLSAIPANFEAERFTQTSSGQLMIDIAGIGLDQFDRIGAQQAATLAGDLSIQLLGGYSPLAGESFEILTAGGAGVIGNFATVGGDDLSGDLFWTAVYNTNSVVLQVETPYTADFDLDGDVDGDDLSIWQSAYGVNDLADANGDGQSSGSDFLAWQQQFGSGVAPLAAFASVPEPTALVTFLVFCVEGMTLRRGRLLQ